MKNVLEQTLSLSRDQDLDRLDPRANAAQSGSEARRRTAKVELPNAVSNRACLIDASALDTAALLACFFFKDSGTWLILKARVSPGRKTCLRQARRM